MRIVKVTTLPEGIDNLCALANEEGYTNISKLIGEYDSGINTFSNQGECLFTAQLLDSANGESPAYELIGIAGLNIDPYCHCANYGRVRRMYVSPPHRRRGVARALIEEIERTAKENFSRLQLFTNSADASSFYQSLGFQQVNNETKVSHVKILSA